MSTDLVVHSPGPQPVTSSALHAALRKRRWHLLILGKSSALIEPADTPLETGLVYDLYGAQDRKVLESARRLLQARPLDTGKLDRLHGKPGLNCVDLSIDPPDEDSDFSMAPRSLIAELKAARLRYLINGHAGPLQWALWKTLGPLTRGILEDPQSGDCWRRKPPPGF